MKSFRLRIVMLVRSYLLIHFALFYRHTGRPIHNFITWQDLRATELTDNWNKSFTLRVITVLTHTCSVYE